MQVWNIVPIVPYILIIILFIQNPGCDVHSAACERNTFTGERYQAGTVQCTLYSVHVPTYCGSGLLGRIWIMGRIRIMGSDPEYGVGSGADCEFQPNLSQSVKKVLKLCFIPVKL